MNESLYTALISGVFVLGTAFITAVASVIGAVLASNKTVNMALGLLREELRATTLKTNFLWRIYAENIVESSVEANMLKRNSPLLLTSRWRDLVPETLQKRIEEVIAQVFEEYTREPFDASYSVNLILTKEIEQAAHSVPELKTAHIRAGIQALVEKHYREVIDVDTNSS